MPSGGKRSHVQHTAKQIPQPFQRQTDRVSDEVDFAPARAVRAPGLDGAPTLGAPSLVVCAAVLDAIQHLHQNGESSSHQSCLSSLKNRALWRSHALAVDWQRRPGCRHRAKHRRERVRSRRWPHRQPENFGCLRFWQRIA
jgi:hypothetical protein